MPFANIKSSGESTFKKTQFMSLTPPGQYVVRVLDGDALDVYRHWINGVWVNCLGGDCPQCELNKHIIAEHPKDASKVTGYSSRIQRFVINVLDKTPVKICPKCETENQKSATVCHSCDTFLVEVKTTPVNVVKIIDKGVKLFDPLNGVESFLNGLEGDMKKITDVDIVITVTGSRKQPSYAAIPIDKKLDPIPADLEKYDRERVFIQLTRKEMLDLMSGVQLKDILVARSGQRTDVFSELEKEIVDSQAAVDAVVKQLYGE